MAGREAEVIGRFRFDLSGVRVFDNIMEWVAKLLGGLGGAGVFAWFINRRKSHAEARKINAEAELTSTEAKHIRFSELESIINEMGKHMARLSTRVDHAEKAAEECRTREEALLKQIQDMKNRIRTLENAGGQRWD
jgi:hypothetical protein